MDIKHILILTINPKVSNLYKNILFQLFTTDTIDMVVDKQSRPHQL
ncbi:hypothetical protein SAMN05660472_01878 [Natronincola ferrireducens]|uniref:Uncharacterized protein n=1 Tax=Natronincola ferrireducens TaxID=393762 RepID=A0A1G9E918_9FIRM|nr:hypothetical protein SAMN05660472_01878 [Natronincola ferrireducens]